MAGLLETPEETAKSYNCRYGISKLSNLKYFKRELKYCNAKKML